MGQTFALAAISAVSRVDIFTRQTGAQTGASLHLEGGVPGQVEEIGCPEGTTICVRDLFYNTPARMKFMKKDSAEGAAVSGIVQHLALSHPEVSFKLLRDGAEVLHTPGDGQLLSAVYAAMGRDFAMGLQEVRGCGGDVQVSGYVTRPLNGHGTRGRQLFFVNGRFVKSQLLSAALEEAYRNRLLKGKFPGCVLHLTLPEDRVDVNVHPAKTVVKFQNERAVFDAVHYAVLSALAGERQTAEIKLSESTKKAVGAKPDFYQSMSAETFRESGYAAPKPVQPQPAAAATAVSALRPPVSAARPVQPVQMSLRAEPAEYETEPKPEISRILPEKPEKSETVPVFSQDMPVKAVEKPVQNVESRPIPDHKIVGEALKTYIIVEQDDKLILIDKHAAHERMIFDRLKAQEREIIDEAYAGDIIGVFDPGIFSIGDTVTVPGKKFKFSGIPTFEPEHFMRVSPKDTMKRKQFIKGTEQIAQEGAIQIFKLPNSGMEEVIVGVVGTLQFDVFQYRMKGEYGVDLRMEGLPYEYLRFIDKSPVADLKDLNLSTDVELLEDYKGRSLLVFASNWSIDYTIKRNPGLELSETAQNW